MSLLFHAQAIYLNIISMDETRLGIRTVMGVFHYKPFKIYSTDEGFHWYMDWKTLSQKELAEISAKIKRSEPNKNISEQQAV